MKFKRTALITDAAGARRRITYKYPNATVLKGRTFTFRGTKQEIMTFRGVLSRYARRTGKLFTTEKIHPEIIRVKRWL